MNQEYRELSSKAMQADNLDNAFTIANMITDEKMKKECMNLIAKNYHEKYAYFIRIGDDKMAQALVEKLPSPQIKQYFKEIIAKTGHQPKNPNAHVVTLDNQHDEQPNSNQAPSTIPLDTQEQDSHKISITQKIPVKAPTRVMPTNEEISKFETYLQTYHEAVKENAWEDIEEATKILTEKHETLLKDRQLYDKVTQKRAEAIKNIANDDIYGDTTANLDN